MSDLVEVRLLGYPLRLWQRSQEHHDELMREFALLALRPPASPRHTVPDRLLTFVAEASAQFADSIGPVAAARAEALARGEEHVDLVYRVPPAAREAAVAYGELLDEVDSYCTEVRLLTLATPPDVRAMRRWFVGEFVAQIDGAAPTAWAKSPFRAATTQF